jgi:hypothetical protein
MLQQLLTIARNTFKESIRQPIFVVLILVGIVAHLLALRLAANTMDDDNKMLIDMGLSVVFLAGLFLAAFTATSVIWSEIQNRTALTVVSKPVSRPAFILGKFFGVAGAITLACYVLSLFYILMLRHEVQQTASDHVDWPVVVFGMLAVLGSLALAAWGNYMYSWPFTSTFCLALAVSSTLATALILVVGKGWEIQSPLAEFAKNDGRLVQVIVGLVLIFEAVMLLTAVAVAVSTRLGQIMTLLVTGAVFLLGLTSNSLSQWTNEQIGLTPVQAASLGPFESFATIAGAQVPFWSMVAYMLAKLLYLVLPNLQFLWPADAITQGNPLTAGHVATVTLYSALYLSGVLCLAVVLFQKREVG